MQQLREARYSNIMAHEQTRRDLATQIHAQVQGRLLVLEYWLKDCQGLLENGPPKVVERLVDARNMLGEIIEQDLRSITRHLYPAIIRTGLGAALRSLADRFQRMFQVEVVVDDDLCSMESSPKGLTHDLRLTLYRVAEEALNNAAKHSQAGSVHISLDHSPDGGICLTISDDGMGCDLDRVSAGNGLLLMEEYAEAMGGTLEMNSAPGMGTTVSLKSAQPAFAV